MIDIEIQLEKCKNKTLISVEDADKVFAYSEKWYMDSQGYAYKASGTHGSKNNPRVFIYLHHLILPVHSVLLVDHIDRNKLNNTRDNLRYANWNTQNTNKIQANLTSKVRGVSWNKGSKRFNVLKKIEGKTTYFGSFETLEEAEAYALKLYKEKGWQIN